MKSLVQFIKESANNIIDSKNELSIPSSKKHLFKYIFDDMPNNGYDLTNDDNEKILSTIYTSTDDKLTATITYNLLIKLRSEKSDIFMITMSELDKYDDDKDLLSDWGDAYYWGDSEYYVELTKSDGVYYAKAYKKPFPYKELGVCTQPEREDYMPTKKDPFKFERTK